MSVWAEVNAERPWHFEVTGICGTDWAASEPMLILTPIQGPPGAFPYSVGPSKHAVSLPPDGSTYDRGYYTYQFLATSAPCTWQVTLKGATFVGQDRKPLGSSVTIHTGGGPNPFASEQGRQ